MQSDPSSADGDFRGLYEFGLEGAFVVARASRAILDVNDKMERLLGKAPDALLGKNADELFFNDEGDGRNRHRDVLDQPGLHEEIPLEQVDGYPIYVSLRVAHIDLPGLGSVAACVVHDTTERRHLERELIAKHSALFHTHGELQHAFAQLEVAQEELARRNRELTDLGSKLSTLSRRAAIGEFSAGVAHSLNNPLAALESSHRQVMKLVSASTDTLLAKQLERFLARSTNAIHRLSTIIESIRGVHRTGRDTQEARTIYLADELELAMALFEARCTGFHVVRDWDPDLSCHVAPALLHQVIANLVDNAIHAMPASGELTLRTFHTELARGISIIDSGPGLPPAVQARLFEPFVTGRPDGSGLGLSTSQRLARSWGGDLIYVPTPRGTRFDILIPNKEDPMSRPKILVVDDDDDVRESLVDELCDSYEVEAASCGVDAIAALSSHEYDAIISDLRMPDRDGIEVLNYAHQKNPDMIRVLLTAYLDDRAHQAMLEPNAPFKLGKPWSDEVAVVLMRAFEHREQQRKMTASVSDALAVSAIDDELAQAFGLQALAEVVVTRVQSLTGVKACGAYLRYGETERRIAGNETPTDFEDLGEGWIEEHPLSADGSLHLRAELVNDSARELVQFLCEHARRWSSADRTSMLAQRALRDPVGRSQLSTEIRRATVGVMTTALMHDLASLVQSMAAAICPLEIYARDDRALSAEVSASIAHVSEVSFQMIQLFHTMRTFVGSGAIEPRVRPLRNLLERTVALCGTYVRARAELRLAPVPDIELPVSEPMFLQVMVNLLRNAAEASPAAGGGKIDVQFEVGSKHVSISISDDGPGVDESVSRRLFEPFVTTKVDSGAGLGLAITADIVESHGGSIGYVDCPGRGATFTATFPLHALPAESGTVVAETVQLNRLARGTSSSSRVGASFRCTGRRCAASSD